MIATLPRLRGAQNGSPAFHRTDLSSWPSMWEDRRRGRSLVMGGADTERYRRADHLAVALQDRLADLGAHAPCEAEPEAWFPETRQGVEAAGAACLACPVFVECARLAHELQPVGGVWAGRDHGSTEGTASTGRSVHGRRTTDHSTTLNGKADR